MKNGVLFIGADNEFEDFPEISYEWNPFLLRSIVDNYYPDTLRVIDPINTDMRYQRGVIVLKNSDYESIDQIVADVMIKNGRYSIREGDFLSFLRMNGLTENVIPQQYKSSRHIEYNPREEIYMFKCKE